ncbi:phage tail tip lysozyme [Puniceibacterium sp. IMCC21224]|uniref:phage tail tip lysozyme n=1 Tax=Puniceibacterium sp. IMCC21224 TaxID=1618204 RepID=UPI00064DB0A3|nr:phage tail tip lysozyme [Puniceibacterium sp. IMCC21224]KMK68585.1 Prophage tail length tape measure protein [Puniceibacterium sp. IMCC21224]
MADKQLNYSLVFRGDTSQAKTALADLKGDVDKATGQTGKSTAATKSHTDGLEKDTAATRAAAEAARDLARAEEEARAAAHRANGARPQSLAVPPGAPGAGPQPGSTPGPDPQQIDDLRAKYAPLYAAQREYERELENINKAEQIGALSRREHAEALARLQTGYERSVQSIDRSDRALKSSSGTMKLTAFEAQNLRFQLSDTFQSLALGMPPLQVLLQQGPQITDIFGGLGQTLQAVRGFLTPARLAIGATAATAVVAATSFNGYLISTKAVTTASEGLGRATAGSAAEMEASARAAAAAAGISIKAAREMQVGFLNTGRIGSDHFKDLIAMSEDFGATLGLDAAAAGGALAEMFSDPAKAADALYQKYGLIDAATARHARNLAAQNRVSEAQAVLLEALPGRLADASEATTALGRAWQDVQAMASNAGDAIGSTINTVLTAKISPEDRLRGLDAEIIRVRKKVTNQNTRAELERLRAERAELLAEISQAEEDVRKKEAAGRALEQARIGEMSLDIAEKSDVNKTPMREEELRNQIAALQAGRGAPGQDGTQRSRIDAAIEGKSNALQGLIDRQKIASELDRIDIAIQNERNPLLRAELEARRVRLQMAGDEVSAAKIATEADRARNRSLGEALGATEARIQMSQQELEIRRQLNRQVAAGTMTSEQANRALQQELELRPLIAAAASAQGAELARLTGIIAQLRQSYAGLTDLENRAAADGFIRGQRETLERLRVEAALLGASAEQRTRTIALLETERAIREAGIPARSAEAQGMRDAAMAMAAETRELNRQIDAWDNVRSAGESAIDGIVDKLSNGDLSGALQGVANDLQGMLLEMSVSNPLKNALLGTDMGTLGDVGGLGGIWERLTGAFTGERVPQISSKSMDVGAMTVTAASVVINGGMAPGQVANVNGAALQVPGVTSGPLPGSQVVQDQAWKFFADKGLKPHQIAGIMGNMSAESGFNPASVGDGGTSFGLFQHHAGRGQGLLSDIGGKGNLGDVNAQLEFAWKELQTSENGAMKRLMASQNVREATGAFVGFERPQGWSAANPEGAMHFDKRLTAANQAMEKFGATTTDATNNLGVLGNGFDVFGSALSGAITGGGGGQGFQTNLLGGLVAGIAGAAGLPGFDVGGQTGGTDPARVAGFVHEKEYVFDAKSTARIGVRNLDAMRRGAMRGYRDGGYASAGQVFPGFSGNQASGQSGGLTAVNVYNLTGQAVAQEETPDGRGGRQLSMTIGAQGAAAVSQRGNPLPRALEQKYSLQQRGHLR